MWMQGKQLAQMLRTMADHAENGGLRLEEVSLEVKHDIREMHMLDGRVIRRRGSSWATVKMELVCLQSMTGVFNAPTLPHDRKLISKE